MPEPSDERDQLFKLARNYNIPPDAIELVSQHPPLIISGVTAVGKNTIISYLLERYPYQRTVTHTTRPKRGSEADGIDYWFVSELQMAELLRRGQMIEAQVIHDLYVYGTSIAEYKRVINTGKMPVADMDVQGILQLSRHVPAIKPIFLLPPSFEVWMQRLGGRGHMSDGEKSRRLNSARQELETALNDHNFIMLVNHQYDVTAREIIDGVTSNPGEQTELRNLAAELLAAIQSN